MLILSILIVLSSISISIRRDVSILFSRISAAILFCCSFLSSNSFSYNFNSLGIFNGLFYLTPITQIFKSFIFIICAIILMITSFYPRKKLKEQIPLYNIINLKTDSNLMEKISISKVESKKYRFTNIKYMNNDIVHQKKEEISNLTKKIFSFSFIINMMSDQFKIIEYTFMIMTILIGAIFLLSTSDFVSLFLCIELQSYGLYLLCTMYKNSELSTSAGLTYFLLGGLASCFILLATSLFYSNSADMNIDSLNIITSVSDAFFKIKYNLTILPWYLPNYITYSLLVLAVGLLFKISAAPFHF
jgi:NADH-ubiquinone oxidoreductase chain 2